MDRREAAFDPFYGSFDERTMTGKLYGDGETIRCHYEVCDVCDGRGTHVNPAIDSNGISAQEFYEDEDFAESYFRGDYDVVCARCDGRNVIPVPDEEGGPYREAIKEHHEYMMEVAAERRMGA